MGDGNNIILSIILFWQVYWGYYQMNKLKMDISISLSRDYNKITLSFIEETLEYESKEELQAKIRQKFTIIKDELELQFEKIQNGK